MFVYFLIKHCVHFDSFCNGTGDNIENVLNFSVYPGQATYPPEGIAKPLILIRSNKTIQILLFQEGGSTLGIHEESFEINTMRT